MVGVGRVELITTTHTPPCNVPMIAIGASESLSSSSFLFANVVQKVVSTALCVWNVMVDDCVVIVRLFL